MILFNSLDFCPAMPKCRLCNDFQRSARQFRFTFDCSEAELSQSANSRCVPCSFLLEGLRRFEPKLGGLKDHDRIYVCGTSVDGDGAVEMEVFSAGALKLRLEFFVTKGKTSPLEGARMLPTIPGDTRAPASMDWAKQRLQQCVDSHVSCGQRSVPKLPTRVLEIGLGEKDRINVRLLETHGVEAQYACLSHRWSRPAALVTRRSNVTSHLNGIDWKTLPKTFEEAILITKDLGLRYLWIDSLCIVQDDVDDKHHEIAKMSSIYANSYITIAATHSDGETHGCYSAGSLYHQDHQLSLKQPDAATVEIDLYVREKIAHIGEQSAMTPLLRRGWVYQERLLSPRVLHFCEKELVWECQESSTCQCSCFDPPIRLKGRYSEFFRRGKLPESNSSIAVNHVTTSNTAPIYVSKPYSNIQGSGHDVHLADFSGVDLFLEEIPLSPSNWKLNHMLYHNNENPIIWSWHDIVSTYSSMDLTNHTDRLPAIAGLASQFGELLNTKYLAGLWQTALPDELLWRTDYTIEPGQHRSQYRAPSWSWASLDGRIKHYRLLVYNPKEFSIVRAVCNPVSDMNPFGEVKTGWLEINALTMPFKITLDLSEGEALSRRRVKIESLTEGAIFVPDYDISVGAAAKYARTLGPQQKEYSFLCVGNFYVEWNNVVVTPKKGLHRVSLVVQKVEKNRYERVGIVDCYIKQSKQSGPFSKVCPRGAGYLWNFPAQWSFQKGLIIV